LPTFELTVIPSRALGQELAAVSTTKCSVW